LRIANNEGGCEPEELGRFLRVLHRMRFPEWLDGTIDFNRRDAWQIYFSETIANMFEFLVTANKSLIAGYFVLVIVAALWRKPRNTVVIFVNAVVRILFTHGLVLLLTLYMLDSTRSSKWAVEIESGKTLMRPFQGQQEGQWRNDPSVSLGPTTLPAREDVLVGTRYAAKSLASYSRWLDFHPGNYAFRAEVSEIAGQLYRSYEQGLPPIFHQHILSHVLESVEAREGRFLQQDYRTGDWRLMSSLEAMEYTRLIMATGISGLTAEMKRELDFLVGDYRFGMLRGTALSRISQSSLHRLGTMLFGKMPSKPPTSSSKRSTPIRIQSSLPLYLLKGNSTLESVAFRNSKRRSSFPSDVRDLRVGINMMYRTKNGNFIPATIIAVRNDERYDIANYGEAAEDRGDIIRGVPRRVLYEPITVIEGAEVEGNFQGEGEWFLGNITRVRPNGAVDILYEDGWFESNVEEGRYDL
jgi:hypothetical protein